MLTDTHLRRYAEVLLWGLVTARSGRFRKGDIVLLRYDLPALPLAEILFEMVMDMGMNPVQRTSLTPRMEHDFYGRSNPKQLTFRIPGDKELY
ncbi:MAG: aminopeptidase, partial [Desulfomonilia bacterium]|nr:aminopeptidase [Desulfomonilia bacterium]